VISWNAARAIAVTLASRTERAPAGDFDYPAAVEETLRPLSDFAGIELPPGTDTARRLVIADRTEWIDFNIEGFGALMEPVLKRAASGAGNVTWALGGATLTAQMGLLLGFLSSLWIVLHEMTHALQFEGYPWLRRHLGSLLESLVGPLSEKLGVGETVRRLSTNLRTGGRSMELVMSPEQRVSFDRMQAAMSVIEGYSDFVMHNVGKNLVPHYEHLKDRMARSRAHRPPFETAVFRLTGMDVKLEQYRLGERFADAVASRQGMDGLNRVWEGPENLPTLAEVRDPGLWMTRMDGAG
jgi:uncharacterized protein (DUF2342 family)